MQVTCLRKGVLTNSDQTFFQFHMTQRWTIVKGHITNRLQTRLAIYSVQIRTSGEAIMNLHQTLWQVHHADIQLRKGIILQLIIMAAISSIVLIFIGHHFRTRQVQITQVAHLVTNQHDIITIDRSRHLERYSTHQVGFSQRLMQGGLSRMCLNAHLTLGQVARAYNLFLQSRPNICTLVDI